MARSTTATPSVAASHRTRLTATSPLLSWLIVLILFTFGVAPVAAQTTTAPSLASLSPCSVRLSSSYIRPLSPRPPCVVHFANIPRSQLNCLIGSIPVTNCTTLDIACQCASEKLSATVTNCMLANCTMQDSLGKFIVSI